MTHELEIAQNIKGIPTTSALLGIGALGRLMPYYLESYPAKALMMNEYEPESTSILSQSIKDMITKHPSKLEDCESTLFPMLYLGKETESRAMQMRFKCHTLKDLDIAYGSLMDKDRLNQLILEWMEFNIF